MTKIKNSFHQEAEKQFQIKKKTVFAQEEGGVLEAKKVNLNKTGGWRTDRPIVATEKCVGCGVCVGFCPEATMEVRNKKGQKKVTIDYDFCKGCGICSQVCPFGAIKMEKDN